MIYLAITSTFFTIGIIANLIIQDLNQIDKQIKEESMKQSLNDGIKEIIERVEFVTGISFEMMKTRSRKREIVIARQVATYKLRSEFGEIMTWQRIADMFNQANHTSPIHGYKTVKNCIETKDPLISKVLENYESADLIAA